MYNTIGEANTLHLDLDGHDKFRNMALKSMPVLTLTLDEFNGAI